LKAIPADEFCNRLSLVSYSTREYFLGRVWFGDLVRHVHAAELFWV